MAQSDRPEAPPDEQGTRPSDGDQPESSTSFAAPPPHQPGPAAILAPAPQPPSSSSAEPSLSREEAQSAYNDLRRLIPSLASELDHLRASLREHNVWLQRYGHAGNAAPTADELVYSPPAGAPPTSSTSAASSSTPASAPRTAAGTAAGPSDTDLPPAYSAADVPPYTGGPRLPPNVMDDGGSSGGGGESSSSSSYSTTEDVRARRDRLTGWLAEGEDMLREYSVRLAQLRWELGMPDDATDDVLGTWNEAGPDNALPDYQVVEDREDRMVGGVGEVPPPYIGGGIAGKGWRG